LERILLHHVEGPRAGDVDAFCQPSIVIGRAPDCHLVFADARSTSSHHAVIRQVDGRIELTDSRSTNGTFVNDERVERRDLNDGDTVRFGALGPLVRIALPERRQLRTARDMPILVSDLLVVEPGPEQPDLPRPPPSTLAETRRQVSFSFMRNAAVYYIGGAFAATQGLDIICNKYGLRREVFTSGLIAIVGGFFATLIAAYYHGAAGTQRFRKKELVLQGLVGLTTAVALGVVWLL
jgi:pSer/pThr/pTyr-binding forkhead associated (FHA) protein